MTKHELKQKAKGLLPLLRIGKNGITENQIKEIKKLLQKKKLVKIKLLKSFIEPTKKKRKEIARDLAKKTDSELVDLTGFVIVLYKG